MASRKKFTYRGYTLEELNELSMDELIELLPARARRSLTRGMKKEHIRLYEKIQKKAQAEGKARYRPIRTHLRDFIVLPNMVGLDFHIHNGKEFMSVKIMAEMIGHYLGEYSPTSKIVKHSAPGIGATRSSMFVPLK